MNNKFKANFDAIKATEELKHITLNNLYHPTTPAKKRIFRPRLIVATLAILIVSLFSFNYLNEATSVMALSLDGDIAIELEVDDQNQVIEITGFDPQSNLLIDSNDYLEANYLDVVNSIQQQVHSQLTISVIYRNQEATLADSIQNAYVVNQETQNRARNYNVSFGKYRLCEEIDELDDQTDLDTYLSMPFNEVNNRYMTQYRGGSDNSNGYRGGTSNSQEQPDDSSNGNSMMNQNSDNGNSQNSLQGSNQNGAN